MKNKSEIGVLSFLCLMLSIGCTAPSPHAISKKKKEVFQNQVPFIIKTFQANSEYPSSFTDISICENWTLQAPQINTLLQTCETIDGHQWHYQYDHLPCQIIGTMEQNNQTFSFAINAGSWINITGQDTSILLGDSDKKYSHLFLEEIWIPQEEK